MSQFIEKKKVLDHITVVSIKKESSLKGIVDETLQGGDVGMSYQKVTDDINAVLYCFPTDIRKGDVIVAKNKYYNVKKGD
ncbi:hypothetical protein ACUC2M_09000 [Bacillus cytotoxicus]